MKRMKWPLNRVVMPVCLHVLSPKLLNKFLLNLVLESTLKVVWRTQFCFVSFKSDFINFIKKLHLIRQVEMGYDKIFSQKSRVRILFELWTFISLHRSFLLYVRLFYSYSRLTPPLFTRIGQYLLELCYCTIALFHWARLWKTCFDYHLIIFRLILNFLFT
jgi:hypothetical protein